MLSRMLLLSALVLTPQAAPQVSKPASAGDQQPVETYPVQLRFLTKDKRAPVQYETAGNLILFKANVAGRDVLALLDNRASPSLIDAGLAQAAGLAFGTKTKMIRTATGELPARLALSVPVAIPGQLTIQGPAAAVDLAPLSKLVGRKIEYVLGAEHFRELSVNVDPGRRTFQLAPSGAAKPPEAFPMVALRGDRPQIEVTVNGQTLLLTVDMGASDGLSLMPAAWARLGIKDAQLSGKLVAGGEGQLHMVDSARLPEVGIGPVAQKDVPATIKPWPAEFGDGLLGMGLLGRFFFVMDVKAGKLWLVPRLSSAVTN
ncbi:retroviral-like aspartic protease family protein [Sphingomonas cannabina]|uniref:aspartyl protease family protein n=1 Tax=Sphingomonas cannabina TaxID=2899123 RepID=UPI001F420408|nr:aspartyl protease family protein [Sphingomonas cannabina]UIJ45270.1 retroviral-like aspartic protease family protein [Sphingomonas cannabina]